MEKVFEKITEWVKSGCMDSGYSLIKCSEINECSDCFGNGNYYKINGRLIPKIIVKHITNDYFNDESDKDKKFLIISNVNYNIYMR